MKITLYPAGQAYPITYLDCAVESDSPGLAFTGRLNSTGSVPRRVVTTVPYVIETVLEEAPADFTQLVNVRPDPTRETTRFPAVN